MHLSVLLSLCFPAWQHVTAVQHRLQRSRLFRARSRQVRLKKRCLTSLVLERHSRQRSPSPTPCSSVMHLGIPTLRHGRLRVFSRKSRIEQTLLLNSSLTTATTTWIRSHSISRQATLLTSSLRFMMIPSSLTAALSYLFPTM